MGRPKQLFGFCTVDSSQPRLRPEGGWAQGWAPGGTAGYARVPRKHFGLLASGLGIDNFTRLTRLYWAKDKKISNISQWRALLAMGYSWKEPKFPIEAKDILLLGVPEGPLIGEILNEVENWWIDSDFIDDKASLFERIKAIVGAKI